MPRGTCLDCVRKHVAQAAILLDETLLGYPHHRWYAAGHLAEAESESLLEHPELAKEIRKARLVIMKSHQDAAQVNLDPLIRLVCRIANEDDIERHEDPNNSKKFDEIALPVAVLMPVHQPADIG